MNRRAFLTGVGASLLTAPAAAAWRPVTQWNFWDDNSFENLVMFGNSYTGQFGYAAPGQAFTPYAGQTFAWRKWMTVDVKPFGVPAGAKEILIGGLGIITGAAGFYLAYRRNPLSVVQDWTWYQQQLLESDPSGGQRTVFSDAIPLDSDGTFQFVANAKNYPDNGADLMVGTVPAVGWNLKLKGWAI